MLRILEIMTVANTARNNIFAMFSQADFSTELLTKLPPAWMMNERRLSDV
jgi:hypothetical protein